MRARDAVETPQRIGALDSHTAGSASPRVGFDDETQRGVSTEGSALFKGHLRVQSTRLPRWDYRSNGYYFVTICTKDRAPFLGEVLDGSARLSKVGEIVAAEWRGIAARRRDVSLDEWVIMPNHVHGILIIRREHGVETLHRKEPFGWNPQGVRRTQTDRDEEMQRGVSTGSRLQAGSLGAIVGQFKSRSTKRLWQSGFRNFGWQPRFYDHIICDDRSLDRIRRYIIDNPAKWDPREANPENLWM